MIKIILTTLFVLSIVTSCVREEINERKEESVTIEKDTTENKIEIDINIKCYGSNQ